MTVRQLRQQQLTPASPPTTSPLAHHALNLYRQCVAAGQWACLNVELVWGGECVTFSSRPWAAATAAARDISGPQPNRRKRRPNARRAERKKNWRQTRGSCAAAASSVQQQQHQTNADCTARQRQQGPSCCRQPLQGQAPCDLSLGRQQQQAQPEMAAAPVACSYAEAASRAVSPSRSAARAACAPEGAEGPAPEVTPADAAIAPVSSDSSCPVTSPRLTRARKRKKEMSPGISQLDGADLFPTSPDPPSPCSSPLRADVLETLTAFPEPASQPERTGAPPPPPWSSYLPGYWAQVICKLCLKGSHGYSRFSSCSACASIR